jgi:hypothetical protein
MRKHWGNVVFRFKLKVYLWGQRIIIATAAICAIIIGLAVGWVFRPR